MHPAPTARLDLPRLHTIAYAIGDTTVAQPRVEPWRWARGCAGTRVTFADGYTVIFGDRMTKRAARSQGVAQRLMDMIRNAVVANEVSL